MVSPNHYEVLGVDPSATAEQVRMAYRSAARRLHPDSGGQVDDMQRLNQAWDVLADPVRRKAYDRELAAAAGSSRTRPATAGSSPDREAGGAGPASGDGFEHDPFDDLGDFHIDDFDDDDLDDEWVPPDGRPPVEGWWALLPPACLALAVGLFSAAFVFASPALAVFAGGALFVAAGLFVFVPLRAMSRATRSRR